jgi:hypothetical protein
MNEILRTEDTKGLSSFQDVPLRMGDLPHLKYLTPIWGGATLQPEQAEVRHPLSQKR